MQHKIVSFHYSFNGFHHLQSLNKKTMASRPNLASFISHSNDTKNQSSKDAGIVKQGYLAKFGRMRTGMKDRYFVLRSEMNDVPAILEKYESEKKFSDGCQPSKKYILKDVSNIIRKVDKNNLYVIALYINKDCTALVTKSEAELHDWLKHLQLHKNSSLQNSNPKIDYEHVWQVKVLPRSFSVTQNLTGKHFLCLTNWFLSLVKISEPSQKKEFPLGTIRKCGNYDQFFCFILGRQSGIGCGELFLQTEDSFIAQNIYQSVLSAMNIYSGRSMSESNMNTFRHRTSSDPHAELSVIEKRVRADSVPTSRKPQSIRKHLVPSLEIIHQQQPPKLDSSDMRLFGSCPEEGQHTPDNESGESAGEDYAGYVVMNSLAKSSTSSTLSSSTTPVADLQECSKEGYVVMSPGTDKERHTPNSLAISPRNISTHPEFVPTICDSGPQGFSSPVSPSILGGLTLWRTASIEATTPSPQTSSAPHSRNPSLLDESYMDMTSPGSQGKSGAASPYLEMRPGPSSIPGNHERQRTISTPTPIPSPSDEDSCYEACNSGSSSCTSGTPSDQRIYDIGVDERGDTPHSGLWNSLSPHYIGGDDVDCLGAPRPIRTNSVGSKPEQFKRKNRLDGAVPIGEPARVRAFSVGSRVSLKFGIGCHGSGGAHPGTEHPTGGLGDIFPSIKECGKQAKSKSSSAPMLGASPISHSWSGTPGTYFRGFIQNRNAVRQTNLMELDFSKNKSCDYIPSEDKDKERKTSKERLLHTITSNRQRSNSKSSGNSGSSYTKLGSDSWNGKDRRPSESEGSSRGLDIPDFAGDRNDYHELDFTPSPRGSNSDPMKGYLPMHPPNFLSSSLTTAAEFAMEKRGPRTSSFNETCLEMSSSLSSCASNDGYVDMTRGGSSGALAIASSSSSSNSLNTPPVGGWPRRTSSSIYTPVVASQELPSPMEGLVKDEEFDFSIEARKKSKKGSKKKSFRESSKKRKSDVGLMGDSPDVTHKNKSQGPLATLTSLITRKPNNNPKTPLSPRGSPLPPKGGKETTSPFSSLTRSKSKGKDLFSEIGEERETVSLAEDLLASTPPSFSPQNNLRRRTLGGLETSPPPSFSMSKGEEKMLLSPLDGKLLRQVSHTEKENETKRNSAYVNMEEATSGSLPSLNLIQKGLTKPLHFVEMRNYVNMQPGSSSPQLSPPATDNSSPKPSFNKNISPLSIASKPLPEDSYMMMGGGENVKEPHVPSFPSAVAKRPEIPPMLLSSHSHSPTLAFEKRSLKEEKHIGTGSERSRSHSGPGAPEGAKGIRKAEDGRAASACSSPISYSPPTSPTLGSVSSMSSLSEGGLSSASSTCTVVNVGLKNLAGSNTTPNAPKVITPYLAATTAEPSSLCTVDNQPCSSSVSVKTNEGESLNYVALDLGSKNNNNNNKASSSPRLASKSGVTLPSTSDEAPLSYVEIDFKKSEGLRNTSLARDSKRPH